MKYLFFKDISRDYGAQVDRVKVGSLWMGVGMYEDADAKKLLKKHKSFISEIDQAQYSSLKKKSTVVERVFRTQPQDASKDPNAVYAKKENNTESSNAEELLSVGEAIVENPLEGTD